MSETVYAIELLHQGKYDSWEFPSEQARDTFYEKTKHHFDGREIANKETADDMEIVQLSATNLNKELGSGEGRPVPYEWYEAAAFEDMHAFIVEQYKAK